MIEIRVQVDDRNLDSLSRDLVAAATKQLAEQVELSLGEYVCPEHNQQPSVTIEVSGSQVEVKVEGCCDLAIQDAESILEALTGDEASDQGTPA